jgi:hypothetical protein
MAYNPMTFSFVEAQLPLLGVLLVVGIGLMISVVITCLECRPAPIRRDHFLEAAEQDEVIQHANRVIRLLDHTIRW